MIKYIMQNYSNIFSVKSYSYEGFTLAEVLITLAIIGIVASLTIPALIQSSMKLQYTSKLQKEYAVLSQAFNSINMDSPIANNPNFSSSTGDNATAVNALNDLATKLNVSKNCGSSTGCWYTTPLKYLGTGSYAGNLDVIWDTKFGKAILADGTMIMVVINDDSCSDTPGASPVGSPLHDSVCGYIWVDVNGKSNPNQIGRDLFAFWIAKTGIFPQGILNDGYSCDITSSTWLTSLGCSGKILGEGAMNY